MKKWILLIIAILICGGTIGSFYFLNDNCAPVITMKSTPKIGCSIEVDDLLDYAEANDEKLKSFFIEEHNITTIVENKFATFVAIDESNNVTKLRSNVELDSDLTSYHIEILKPLTAQLKTKIETSEYIEVRNKCGWTVNKDISIEGVNYSTAGTYDVKVYSKKNDDIEPVYTKLVVADYKSPKITLKETEGVDSPYEQFSKAYFLNLIDKIEDDNDDSYELYKLININWEDVLEPDEDGYVSKTGTYTITYKVIDSEGNVGSTSYKLTLE